MATSPAYIDLATLKSARGARATPASVGQLAPAGAADHGSGGPASTLAPEVWA